jgi:hypothetical protein
MEKVDKYGFVYKDFDIFKQYCKNSSIPKINNSKLPEMNNLIASYNLLKILVKIPKQLYVFS